MNLELLLALLALALVDSTSFGTLVIPLWLLLAPGRFRPARVLWFLFTVAAFYLGLGVLLAAGAATISERVDGFGGSTQAHIFQLLVGMALLAVGIFMEPLTKAGRARRASRRSQREAHHGPGRLTRWRLRAMDGSASATAVVGLALGAAAIETASMVPYLAAIGMLTAAHLSLGVISLVLVFYCLVMIMPALILLSFRILLHERITPTLTKLEGWTSRHGRETTAWLVGVVGFYVTLDAASVLFRS